MSEVVAAFMPQLTHVGVACFDLDVMEEFYTRIVGLVATDRGRGTNFVADYVFLSGNPENHHQLALSTGRDPVETKASLIKQLSFKLENLDQLRVMYRRVVAAEVEDLRVINHGTSWSLYFFDPERNIVEFYVDSPWYIGQPHAEPFDPEMPTAQIIAETEAMCRKDPKFQIGKDFNEGVRLKLEESMKRLLQ